MEEAENALRLAAVRGVEVDELLMLEHDIAFVKSDRDAMDRAAARARQRSGADTWISNKEAYAAAYEGQVKKANALTQRAVDQAVQEAQPERAALWEAGKSVREAFFGDAASARQSAMSARERSSNREVAYGAALALAICGDSARAQTIADDLEKNFPEDSMVKFHYLPVLRARIALNQGHASQAIDALQPAAAGELGASLSSFGALYPVFMRGEARLASHDGPGAIVQFQKILDHRGIVGSDPIGALAQLQIARSFLLAGDKSRAKAAYDSFLALWREADPEVPVLQRARAEYAKLS